MISASIFVVITTSETLNMHRQQKIEIAKTLFCAYTVGKMATFFKNFPVSEADLALLEEIDSSSRFINNTAMEKELKESKKRKEQLKLQPYADMLFDHIMETVEEQKRSIKDKLMLDLSKDTKYPSFELMEYNSVMYSDSLEEKIQKQRNMTEEERTTAYKQETKNHIRIRDNGWDATFALTRNGYYSMAPVRLDRIFRYTDILRRIANEFGTKYKVYNDAKYILVQDEHFCVWKKSLRLVYKSDGPLEKDIQEILAVRKKYGPSYKTFWYSPSCKLELQGVGPEPAPEEQKEIINDGTGTLEASPPGSVLDEDAELFCCEKGCHEPSLWLGSKCRSCYWKAVL